MNSRISERFLRAVKYQRNSIFSGDYVLKESTILILFATISPFVPFLLLAISLIQPIYGYAPQIGLGLVSSSEGNQGLFIMDISSYVRAQLIHGLFAGFMSGVMFAIAFVKWIDQRKSDRISPDAGNVQPAPVS